MARAKSNKNVHDEVCLGIKKESECIFQVLSFAKQITI